MSYAKLCQIANQRKLAIPTAKTTKVNENNEDFWEIYLFFAGFTTFGKSKRIKEAMEKASSDILKFFPENAKVEPTQRKMIKDFIQKKDIEFRVFPSLGGYKVTTMELNKEFSATADSLNGIYSAMLSVGSEIFSFYNLQEKCEEHREPDCPLCHKFCDICRYFGQTCDDCRRM
ncbi:hypothetical protein [Shahe hepe-like virus 1]|uniref:hypothetical protein n=1 Tax=Shahe hepe-like virus 1 TaxID=1923415 RepID=UPI000909B308|nr:hypothetical protein [Shahe hepe-like virus 1]APG77714.1 hypothetical protein [Shahe hepe-like virus 1]